MEEDTGKCGHLLLVFQQLSQIIGTGEHDWLWTAVWLVLVMRIGTGRRLRLMRLLLLLLLCLGLVCQKAIHVIAGCGIWIERRAAAG